MALRHQQRHGRLELTCSPSFSTPPADSRALGKPMIVEEFGAQANRDAIFK